MLTQFGDSKIEGDLHEVQSNAAGPVHVSQLALHAKHPRLKSLY